MIKQSKVKWTFIIVTGLLLLWQSSLFGLTVNVQEPNGTPVAGFRWLVEEDTTNYTIPGIPVANSIGFDIHNSYNPVVIKGHSDSNTADVNVPSDMRYFISVLPDADHSMGGAPVDINQTNVTVFVQKHPIPTAQISVLAFVDHASINNVYDAFEQGLGGASVVIADLAGQQMMDVFGNMLGTTYQKDANGVYILDAEGAPIVDMMGSGVKTLTQEEFDTPGMNPYNLKVGEALIKNLAPGKYGVIVIPPALDDNGNAIEWIQTATIEGTPTIDAWVKANEPQVFIEGFGTGFNHVVFGYVKTGPTADSNFKGQTFSVLPWNSAAPVGTGTITGRLRYNHFSRPPITQGFWPGAIIDEGWIGLNDPASGNGLYAAECNPDGTFVISNVPAGTYELVTWDKPLINLFGFHTVTIGDGQNLNLGDILEYRWFGTYEGSVFYDTDKDGFRDPDEVGITGQNINIRFRDGTIYQAAPTTVGGEYSFSEVFPFFRWLVVEVDFARFKDTGMTAVVDGGGEVQPDNGWDMPSFDKLNPQGQYYVDPNTGFTDYNTPIINPNTGNNLSRTQVSTTPSEVLLQAMQLFLNQTNYMDWGKVVYDSNENGGITGIVYYDTTRAENDPRYNAGESWQPGIPRVQVNLYQDINPKDGIIDNLDSNAGPTLADVDNYPFGWRDGTAPFDVGIDIDRNSNGTFDAGDAIQIVTTDSWDDNKPTGSIGPNLTVHGETIPIGMDEFATWNQIRPGVFDGGYSIQSYFPGGIASGSGEVGGLPIGTYIVEAAVPPGYELVKEEDKNVDFGDVFVPSPLLLPPVLVGDLHLVPAELSLFPGVPCEFAGQMRPLADRKQIIVSQSKNAACDFFIYTEVPKAARGVGFVLNDLTAEFNAKSINFGEKSAAAWIPIALRDWTGKEFHRIYSDEAGNYNFLLHSTFNINVPAPSGVGPQMVTLVLNDPIKPDGSIDEFYNPTYSITPWTLHYYPGTTSYLDTPIVPLAAFSAADVKLDTEPNNTPVIYSLDGPSAGFGPVINQGAGGVITIQSKGTAMVLNPAYDPNVPGSPFRVSRSYGFGATQGQVLLDGQPLAINSWSDATIEAVVPTNAATGRITVIRGDNGTETDVGVTLHVVNMGLTNIIYVPADYATIQEAVDASNPGDLILVAPGTYNENVIMNKPVRLQGSGSGGTTIFGYPNPAEVLTQWHDKINALAPAGYVEANLRDAFTANEAPAIIVIGEINDGGATINPGFPFNTPGEAMIDGFECAGSISGGGIYAPMGASNLTVSNNLVTGNQGNSGGGVVIGHTNPNFDLNNDNVIIRFNKIAKNGGIQGPAGIAIYAYSDNYKVEGNLVWGNFSRFNGGGIGHIGYSGGDNLIQYNTIIFNEDFFGAALAQAGDGGGLYIGGEAAGGEGAGNVTINSNLIQGNMTGSGFGGGIRAAFVNGADITASPSTPDNWNTLNIFNNIIVNNVAGLSGAGISLQDVAKANIINNTIANNDSTGTAQLAFQAGQLNSTPQPAGVVSAPHSDLLAAMFGAGLEQTYSNPVLNNNIIWHNRSWYNDASLNGGQGGLAPRTASPYWDLAVLGSTTSGDPHLMPDNCVLTSIVDSETGYNYNSASGNVSGDPMFMGGYENMLQTAAVLDEGGNFINVLISPLTIEGSDYHINSGSLAELAGSGTSVNLFAELGFDYDTDTRTPAAVDIGADQISTGGVVPVEIIVDNLDAGNTQTGIWLTSSGTGYWATNSVGTNTAGSTFTFNTNLVPGTTYAVYGWWTYLSNRVTNAPYEIRDGATLLDTVVVNQRLNTSQWVLLGTYTFNNGPASIKVSVPAGAPANSSTNADAVRFVPVTAPLPVEVIVDNLDAGNTQTGTWLTSSATGYWATNSVGTNTAGSTFTFNTDLVPGTTYAVYGWWTYLSNRVTNAPYEIRDGATLLDTVVVNQRLNTSQWVLLGTYTFNNGPASIKVSVPAGAPANSSTNADAVQFVPVTAPPSVPVEVIVDNLDAGNTQTGTWLTSSATGFWATNSVATNTAGSTFTFNTDLVPGTTYAVYGWWTYLSNRVTNAPYEIRDGATLLDTVVVNQRLNTSQWVLLGTYTFNNGPASIKVSVPAGAPANSSTNADAIRFIPVP